MSDEISASHMNDMTTVCLQSFLCRMNCVTLEALLQSSISVVSVKREFLNSREGTVGQRSRLRGAASNA